MSLVIWDIETLSKPAEEILANIPPWDIEEAKTRVPKNYKKEEAISSWLEQDHLGWTVSVLENAALSPDTSSVCIAGFWMDGEVEQNHIGAFEHLKSEADLIEECFFRLRGDSIGWNTHGYDLPYLVKRAWILGVKVPRTIFNPTSRYPIPDRMLDGMKVWQCGNFKAPFTSLDRALRSMGLPGKPYGKEFAKMWAEDPQKALAYNADEIRGQADLYKRMGIEL